MTSAKNTDRMKAIQIKQFNTPYKVSDVPVPTPEPHQVLVKIKAGGFCHTDCMVLEGAFGSKLPVIGSHEPAGIVAGVGSEVTEFKKGDRVGCLNFDSCCGEFMILDFLVSRFLINCLGKCPDCLAGKPIYCDSPKMKGLTMDGAWAEYMAA